MYPVIAYPQLVFVVSQATITLFAFFVATFIPEGSEPQNPIKKRIYTGICTCNSIIMILIYYDIVKINTPLI